MRQTRLKKVKLTNQIGEESKSTKSMDGRLGGLRLLFTMHIGDQRDVDQSKVLVSDTELKLAHRLHEGRGFNVTNRTTKLSRTLVSKSRL